jgi:hypothetical protein
MPDKSYLQRALAAYYSGAGVHGPGVDEPSMAVSGERGLNGKDYVVLANAYKTLAVYRIKPDGFLRRLRRWPAALVA